MSGTFGIGEVIKAGIQAIRENRRFVFAQALVITGVAAVAWMLLALFEVPLTWSSLMANGLPRWMYALSILGMAYSLAWSVWAFRFTRSRQPIAVRFSADELRAIPWLALGFVAYSTMSFIGNKLFVVPGIFVSTVFAVMAFAFLDGKPANMAGVIAAFKSSWALVLPRFFKVFFARTITGIMVGAYGAALIAVFAVLSMGIRNASFATAAAWVLICAIAMALPLPLLVDAPIYQRLKEAENAVPAQPAPAGQEIPLG